MPEDKLHKESEQLFIELAGQSLILLPQLYMLTEHQLVGVRRAWLRIRESVRRHSCHSANMQHRQKRFGSRVIGLLTFDPLCYHAGAL